jgi:hypothetical protein
MTYKETLLTGRSLADKIRSGEYKEERKSRVGEVQVDPNAGLIPRRQRKDVGLEEPQGSSEDTFYQDLLMSYMLAASPMGQEVARRETEPSWYTDKDYSGVALSSEDVDLGTIAVGIREAADELGIDPVDLATVISYETGGTFNPTQKGPTTQWGTHRGLIQFGEPQAQEYGVDWSDPYGSQLGAGGAIVKYLRGRGVTPGMGLLDIYSTVNAGAPGLYDRSDANNGGAPGTVRDKVENQMQGHFKKALALMEGSKPRNNPRRA